MVKDILFITEGIEPPFDEGGTKIAITLIKNQKGNNIIVNWSCAYLKINGVKYINVKNPKNVVLKYFFYIFFIFTIFKIIIHAKPKKIIYFPLSYPRFRQQIFSFFFNKFCRLEEILFQTNDKIKWTYIFRGFKIIVINKKFHNTLLSNNINVDYLDPKDIVFLPKKNYSNKLLRTKYGFKERDFIVSHIGHNTGGRGLDVIMDLAEDNKSIKFLIVLSSRNKSITSKTNNLKIINYYIDDINEVYALSDVYIFPLMDKSYSIDIPLSILEARSMNLPIIASDEGVLKEALKGYEKSFMYKNNKKDKSKTVKLISNILLMMENEKNRKS